MKKAAVLLFSVMLLSAWSAPASAGGCEVFLSDLIPLYENNVHSCLQFDTVYWQPDIVIDGVVYPKGIGMHPPDPTEIPSSNCRYFVDRSFVPGSGTAAWKLNGAYQTFLATIALAEQNGSEPCYYNYDAEETWCDGNGVVFRVYLDGQLIYSSSPIYFETPPLDISLNVSGGNVLVLEVDSDGSNWKDHSVWANARLQRP
jgi:hypothetical protein